MVGFRRMLGVWPAALTAGVGFAIPQFLVSNFHGPWLVDIVASLCSMAGLVFLLRFWKPRDLPSGERISPPEATVGATAVDPGRAQAWLPWILLSAMVFL